MNWAWLVVASVGGFLTLTGESVQAVPGQTLEEAKAWIKSNPTLQPTTGETLRVSKTDTPARRFAFQASLLPVGRIAIPSGDRRIRSEEISLFDMINGVTRPRLEESLRVVYGPLIYQDYLQATVVTTYPAVSGQSGLKGELRRGDRFAYRLELAKRPDGFAYIGRMTVFLLQDLPKLEQEIQ